MNDWPSNLYKCHLSVSTRLRRRCIRSSRRHNPCGPDIVAHIDRIVAGNCSALIHCRSCCLQNGGGFQGLAFFACRDHRMGISGGNRPRGHLTGVVRPRRIARQADCKSNLAERGRWTLCRCLDQQGFDFSNSGKHGSIPIVAAGDLPSRRILQMRLPGMETARTFQRFLRRC